MIIVTGKMGFCAASLLLIHSDAFTGKPGRAHQWKSNFFLSSCYCGEIICQRWRSLLESREDIEMFSIACSDPVLLIQNILLKLLSLLLLIFSASFPSCLLSLQVIPKKGNVHVSLLFLLEEAVLYLLIGKYSPYFINEFPDN